jgi:hypothetical protein
MDERNFVFEVKCGDDESNSPWPPTYTLHVPEGSQFQQHIQYNSCFNWGDVGPFDVGWSEYYGCWSIRVWFDTHDLFTTWFEDWMRFSEPRCTLITKCNRFDSLEFLTFCEEQGITVENIEIGPQLYDYTIPATFVFKGSYAALRMLIIEWFEDPRLICKIAR